MIIRLKSTPEVKTLSFRKAIILRSWGNSSAAFTWIEIGIFQFPFYFCFHSNQFDNEDSWKSIQGKLIGRNKWRFLSHIFYKKILAFS